MLFGGISEHTLDPNGRIIIPERLRYSLGQEFIITLGLGKCLRMYTQQVFSSLDAEIGKMGNPLTSQYDPDILALRHHLFSEMVKATTDRQFRVLIPPKLREYAEVTTAAVLVGVRDWVEVWNPDNWKAYTERALTDERLIGAGGRHGVAGGIDPTEGDAGVPQTSPA